MQPFDATTTALLWEVAPARCVLTRHEGARRTFEIAVFYGDILVRDAVFTDHEVAASYAIDELHFVDIGPRN